MEPSFDIWSIVFLVATVQGSFLSILLFLRRSTTNRILGSLILSFSICLLYYVLFWTGYFRVLPWQLGVLQGLTFLFGPLVFFYLKSDGRNAYFDWRQLMPFVGYCIYYVTDTPPRFFPGLLSGLQIAHLVVYTGLIIHSTTSVKGLSNGALKRHRWHRKVIIAFSGYTLSFLLYYALVLLGWLKVEYDYMISLASSIFIYFIGYHGFQHQEVLRMNEMTKYDRSSLSATASRHIMKKIREMMDTEQLYLKSSLKLQDLTEYLELKPHHISQAINEGEDKHFSDFINEYRIARAKKLLIESDDKIIQIAFATGFNNKASFNNAFKKIVGSSPSSFREKHLLLA